MVFSGGSREYTLNHSKVTFLHRAHDTTAGTIKYCWRRSHNPPACFMPHTQNTWNSFAWFHYSSSCKPYNSSIWEFYQLIFPQGLFHNWLVAERYWSAFCNVNKVMRCMAGGCSRTRRMLDWTVRIMHTFKIILLALSIALMFLTVMRFAGDRLCLDSLCATSVPIARLIRVCAFWESCSLTYLF